MLKVCFLYKKNNVYSKCGMLHKSLKCVIFQALAGLLVFILFSNSPFLIRQKKWRVSTSRNSPFFMRQYKWRVSTSRNSPLKNLKIRGELRKVGVAIRNSPFFSRNSPLFRNSPFFVTLHLAILLINNM